MNCKPGDLAFVLRARHVKNLGKIVKVIKIDAEASSFFGCPMWLCEGSVAGRFARDKNLQPIQNPGDDVHDVRDILIPQHLKETA